MIKITVSQQNFFDPENPPPMIDCYICGEMCLDYEDLPVEENICNECRKSGVRDD